MRYEVVIRKKAYQGISKLPVIARRVLRSLLLDLENGPVQPKYKHYGKLKGDNKYHCHLDYHWVACWECKEKRLIVEVYYVGSRESAPYSKH